MWQMPQCYCGQSAPASPNFPSGLLHTYQLALAHHRPLYRTFCHTHHNIPIQAHHILNHLHTYQLASAHHRPQYRIFYHTHHNITIQAHRILNHLQKYICPILGEKTKIFESRMLFQDGGRTRINPRIHSLKDSHQQTCKIPR